MGNYKQFAKKVLQKLGFLKRKKHPSIIEWEAHIRKAVKRPVKMILPYIKEDAIFIDVGANVGVFTEAVLNYRKNITAHLFEPVPQYFQWLIDKFTKNPNVFINKVALSDKEGHFSIWIDADNLGWNTMISEKISVNMQELTIDSIIFDDYVRQNNIVKIDASPTSNR